MNDNLLNTLTEYFGYTSFRSGQAEIINTILSNKQVVAILPTGAGKSICYQIPAIISDNFSIVISPLIALMKDQVDSLNSKKEIAAFINSTMSFNESENVLSDISFGKIKLLYLSPEKLENVSFAEKLINLKPSHLFIDEAHCISEWGHNFRPGYLKITEFIEHGKIKNIAAFTATATPEVIDDIIHQLKLKSSKLFVRGFERENLHVNVILTKNKKQKSLELVKKINGTAIIYTASRKSAEEASEYLNMYGVKTEYYHAGVHPAERRRIQDDFISGNLNYIAATNAFGMGIDKKDVRLIIHYNIPGSIENYYQEIGRAGRDGKDSFTYLLFNQSDLAIHNYFLISSNPDKDTIKKIYKAICDFNRVAIGVQPEHELLIDENYIANYVGKSIGKGLISSCFRFLESAGYVKSLSEYDKKDSLKFLYSKNRLKEFVINTSNHELKNLVLVLIREYGSEIFTKGVMFLRTQLASKLEVPERIVAEYLSVLDNMGVIEYKGAIAKDALLLTVPRVDDSRLNLNYKKINESFINSQKKLDKIVDYVYTKECRFKFILEYFGEDVKNYKCGNCDNCADSTGLSSSAYDYVSEIILKTLGEAETAMNENVLIKIIRGEKLKQSFEQFEFFGACENYNKNELKIILHELISKKLLRVSPGSSRYTELTQNGFVKLDLLGWKKNEAGNYGNYSEDLILYNLLREARKGAARKFMQTSYLICPDVILKQIANQKPKSKSDLLAIKGFNQRMYNKLGDDFLEILSDSEQYEKPELNNKQLRTLPQNISETYNLLLKKHSLKEISELRKQSEAVISMQIESILEYEPKTEVDHLFTKNEFDLIKRASENGYDNLKDLKKKLPQNISYALIRIALAKTKFNSVH